MLIFIFTCQQKKQKEGFKMIMIYKKFNKKITIRKNKKDFLNCHTSCQLINKCSEISTCEEVSEYILREMKEGRF